jgi:hypothetical protein
MAESVSVVLKRLRFQGGFRPVVYMNDERLKQAFISELGAIESFVATAAKEGGASIPLPFLSLAGKGSRSDAVTYSLDEPLTKSLILREVLFQERRIHEPSEAMPGDYTLAEGLSSLYRGEGGSIAGMPETLESLDGFSSLLQERQRQEGICQLFVPEGRMLLLTLWSREKPSSQEKIREKIVAAGVLSQDKFQLGGPESYIGGVWDVFGQVERRIDEIPVVAPFAVTWIGPE